MKAVNAKLLNHHALVSRERLTVEEERIPSANLPDCVTNAAHAKNTDRAVGIGAVRHSSTLITGNPSSST